MNPKNKALVTKLAVVLVLKLVILTGLWWGFVREQRVRVDANLIALTLGMVWMLVIMESVYVMTGNVVWKDMTRFWGKLFGINFALGVTTGITLEFQFGTNWAYYSRYVGDIFGVPLAIEGLMAFVLESTMIGLFFSAGIG